MTQTMKRLLIVVLSIAFAFSISRLLSAPTANADPVWSGDYSAAQEGDDVVYTAPNNGVTGLTYSESMGTNNKFDFSFRPNQDNFGGYDSAHLTLYLDLSDGQHVAFKIMHYWRALTVLVYNADYSSQTATLIDAVNYASNDGGNWDERANLWYDASIEINAYQIYFTVAGATFASGNPGYDFTNCTPHFGSWACAPSVRNMSLSEITGWYGTNARSVENNETVNTVTSADLVRSYYVGDTTGVNDIEFDFRPNSTCWGDTCNLTFCVSNGTQTLTFSLWHYYRALLYKSDGNDIGSANYVPQIVGWSDYDAWYHLRIHFERSKIAVLCNGAVVYSTGADWYMDFNDLTLFFSSWGCTPSFKNVTVSQTQAPDGWYGNYNHTVSANEDVYAAHSAESTELNYQGSAEGVNTVEFEFTLSEYYINDTQNVTFLLSNGEVGLGISMWNYWKALFLNMYNGDYSTKTGELAVTNYPVKTDSWSGYDVWYKVKMIFAPRAIYVYINDGLYISSCVDYEINYSNLSFKFFSYGSADTIKNITLSHTDDIAIPHVPVVDEGDEAGCESIGHTDGSHCGVCGEVLTEKQVVPALGHSWGKPAFTWTETENGFTATATRVCANDNAHVQEVAAVVTLVTDPASCEENGALTYTATATFGEEEFAEDKVVAIVALGHEWNAPTFTWTETESGFTATAARVCANDNAHVQQVDAAVTFVVTSPASCEEGGSITYTATATFGEEEFTEDKVVEIAAAGHAWGQPAFTWTETEDGFTATATRVCANDPAHTETVEATVVKGKNESGKSAYIATAVFGEEEFTAERPFTKKVSGCGANASVPATLFAMMITALVAAILKKRSLAE